MKSGFFRPAFKLGFLLVNPCCRLSAGHIELDIVAPSLDPGILVMDSLLRALKFQ